MDSVSPGDVWRIVRRLRLVWLEPLPRRGTGLLAGRGGWIFWIGQRRHNLEHWRDTPKMRRRLEGWAALVRKRATALAAMGVAYRLAIMPDKLSIHHAKLVDPEIDPAMAIGRRVQTRLRDEGFGETVIDLFSPLAERASDEDLYLRTDTHYTPAGYTLAYRVVCAALGAEPAGHVVAGAVVPGLQHTDLGTKLDPPELELAGQMTFERRAVRLRENELTRYREAQAGHIPGISVGSTIVLRNDGPCVDPRCVMVFGDSFTFADAGLGAMLAESFREVHLVWSTRLDFGLIADTKPDIVLTEVAEFFIGPVPVDDGFSVEALAAQRLATVKAGGALTAMN